MSFDEPDWERRALRAVSVLVVFLLIILWGVVHVVMVMTNIRLTDLQLHGVRGTATVVSIRSEPRRRSAPAYYAKITFAGGVHQRVAEIEGEYAKGDKIPIVYSADDPSVVETESRIAAFQAGPPGLLIIFSVDVVVALIWALIWLRKRRSG
ncbi:DUF3592 domain-containing protein [Streptosporangium sp. NPDC051023]|uniref:DUF3592 domain-containing protein n=1 Tax=Streptosporangium sp. NPDC051023 TaxID=3155410 RepID=UPI00344FA5F0